ncbi:DoxX family protein [Brevundimonas sp.]|jgi:hypothetical protein|uniref:DoxX family protein n=1 Tax=Brevundimonas sp. TaxID=1871086 RepID=UPI0037C0980B
MTFPTHLIGRILVSAAALALLLDGALLATSAPPIIAALGHAGFEPRLAPVIGLVILGAALLLLIPRLAPLGAILCTGFLGGAICAHVRIGELGSPPQIICLVLGALIWGGLLLADSRVRCLMHGAATDRPGPIPLF